MLVSELIQMDIPARKLLKISGLTTTDPTITKRTVAKARRGLESARQRLKWDNTVKLDEVQQRQLNAALQEQHQQHEERRLLTTFQQGLVNFAKALDQETAESHTFHCSYTKYLEARATYLELQKKLDLVPEKGADPAKLMSAKIAMTTFGDSVSLIRQEVIDVFKLYKECINATKAIKITIERARATLRKAVPKLLTLDDKRAISQRKKTYIIMEGVNNAKPNNVEAVDTPIS